MIWGAIVGAVVGLIYYILRRGGVVFVRDLQEAGLGRPHVVVIMAISHALVPAGIGALIGWAIA